MSHPLECINDQIQNHMPKSKNCNMPVVNWCLNHGPCNAQIHPEPEFVNPWKGGCREKKYPVVHNKCDVSSSIWVDIILLLILCFIRCIHNKH